MRLFRTPSSGDRTLAALALLGLTLTVPSCSSLNKEEKGAVIGAGTGAAAGAVVGHNTGSTARGAIIGAIVGGTAGAIIGHQMDQQAKELKQNIPGARVERVGEGIAVTFESGLLYDIDSDHIRPAAATNLKNLAASLEKYPNTDLLIVGHTDATGTTAHNQDLSERRARSASSYLQSQGVSAKRIRTTGRGEAEPIASNDTDDGRQLNRRVEVAIYANAAAKKDAQR